MKRLRHVAVFVSGAALSLAFAPFGWFVLAFVCPAVLFLLWEGATGRQAAWLGFWFGAGTFLAGTYWLYTSIHVLGGAPLWLALFLMLSLVAIMGLYHALVGCVAARWLPRTGALRWLLCLPAVWVTIEWLRGWVLSGFPWLSLGYSQIDSWLAAYAPVGGVYTVSLACAFTAGVLVALVRGNKRERIISAIALVLVWGVAAALHQVRWTQPAGEALSVALVQGAIPQDLKWQRQQRERTLARYIGLTEPVLGRDLIIWPEAALPVLAHQVEDELTSLQQRARAAGSDVVLGILRYDFDSGEFHNSMLVLGERREWYNKRRLVPFGEFFPVPDSIRSWMRLMNLPYTDMTRGDPDQPALNAAGQRLGATICYEDAYGSQQLRVLREATLLVNITNDAWFGDSTAPHQHLEIARMRALEAGRYLLRAANDGVTAVIGPTGRVLEAIPQFRPGVLEAVVEPRTGLTPYARIGNAPVVVFCLLVLAGGLAQRFRERRHR